jgi:hypothetical protein
MKTCLGHCLARPLTYAREGQRRDRPESGRRENECSRSSRTIQILRAVSRGLRIVSGSSSYPTPALQLCPVLYSAGECARRRTLLKGTSRPPSPVGHLVSFLGVILIIPIGLFGRMVLEF